MIIYRYRVCKQHQHRSQAWVILGSFYSYLGAGDGISGIRSERHEANRFKATASKLLLGGSQILCNPQANVPLVRHFVIYESEYSPDERVFSASSGSDTQGAALNDDCHFDSRTRCDLANGRAELYPMIETPPFRLIFDVSSVTAKA